MSVNNSHTFETHWNRAMPGALVNSDEVHVWRAALEMNDIQKNRLLGLLSVEEREKAGKFRFDKDRDRFIMARGMLRKILGDYLETEPQELRFVYNSFGKPALDSSPGDETLHFNLSHSGAFVLYAVTRDRDIGIDIEKIQDDVDIDQISQRFFSEQEIRFLQMMPVGRRTDLFYQYWTRKEAFIKALGKGVSFPMETCDVSLCKAGDWKPIDLLGDTDETSTWYGQDLFPGMGYAAAIAVRGGDSNLSFWQYSD